MLLHPEQRGLIFPGIVTSEAATAGKLPEDECPQCCVSDTLASSRQDRLLASDVGHDHTQDMRALQTGIPALQVAIRQKRQEGLRLGGKNRRILRVSVPKICELNAV